MAQTEQPRQPDTGGSDAATVTEQTLRSFAEEFVLNPYLCYTEHGLHALFFARLYAAFRAEHRYFDFRGHKVCTIQKEYPTYHRLIRARRQNWDIAVIRLPVKAPACGHPYDYLPLAAVVEFGLNCGRGHVHGDVERLVHSSSNVGRAFVAHFYRFTGARDRFCGRDMSPKSKRRCTEHELLEIVGTRDNVAIYFGIADVSAPTTSGLWRLSCGRCEQLLP